MIRRSCRTLKHLLWAVVWLVGVVCCAEVAWHLHIASQEKIAIAEEIPLVPSHTVHHHLKPASTLTMISADAGKPLSSGDEKPVERAEAGHQNAENREAGETEIEPAGTVTVTLNSLGLRGPEPRLHKNRDLLRVLCLGDELVFGPGISDGDLFTAKLQTQLEEHLPVEVEVINAGVPGYCPLLSYLQYRHHLRSLKPDIVIQTFEMSDVAEDYSLRLFAQLDESGAPLVCSHPALNSNDRMKSVEEHFLTLRWAKSQIVEWETSSGREGLDDISRPSGRYAWTRDTPPDWEVYIANALEPVVQLRDLARESAAVYLFVAFPAPWQVSEAATGFPPTRKKFGIAPKTRYKSRSPFERLQKFTSENELEYLDVSEVLGQVGNREDLYRYKMPWLTKRGHEVYSTILAGRLIPRLQSRLRHYRTPAETPATADANRSTQRQ